MRRQEATGHQAIGKKVESDDAVAMGRNTGGPHVQTSTWCSTEPEARSHGH